MFDSFKKWLFDTFFRLWLPFFGLVGQIFTPVVAVALVVYEAVKAAVAYLWDFEIRMGKITQAYNTLKQMTGEAAFGWMPPAIQELFVFVNYMIPVSAGVLMVGTLCVLYLICVTIRMIKGLVPTWN